jgi:protein involved in polysaccharide export with SLBB domain
MKRAASVAGVLALAVAMTGCTDVMQDAKNLGDYLNLRNGLLDPSQVGRFDKDNPWGRSKAVTWPILDTLDSVDEPNTHWTNATDPLPSDLVVETQEYVVGQGDYLDVTVFELVTPGLPYQETRKVDELGNIRLQNVGNIHVDGLTPSEIEKKIGDVAVDKGFLLRAGNGSPGPQVSVQLRQSQGRIFSILGQVGAPSTYFISQQDFRLLDALAMAHDLAGGTQPGLDYLYIIRPEKGAGIVPPPPIKEPDATSQPTTSPLNTLDQLKQNATAPASQPSAQMPQSDGPVLVRALPQSIATLSDNPTLLAQVDLDAAISGAASRPTTVAPGGSASVLPLPTATAPATGPAPSTGEAMMNQATGGKPNMIYVNGKWVEAPAASNPAMTPTQAQALASSVSTPRVIRIPITKLVEGDPRYNIVIRPGDIIRVPNIEPGEFYLLGHVGRPGVYTLTGRKVTLKQAIAASGGLDAVAIPRRCDLIRRIGNTEVTVQVDLQRIFDGEQPDIFLKANDLVNVGTDLVAPFLAVTRNAYRASYGWGFTYDRNLYNQPVVTQNR